MTELEVRTEKGEVISRLTWVICLIFRAPFPEVCVPLKRALESGLAQMPNGALVWGCIGASAEELKPLGPRGLARCVAMFEPKEATRRSISAFQLQGPQESVADFVVRFVGDSATDPDLPDQAGYLEFRYPWSFMLADEVAQLAARLFSAAPISTGYASPGLGIDAESRFFEFASSARGILLRHPGLDVPIDEGARFDIGDRCLGARWITFLGKPLVEQLGGAEQLRSRCPGLLLSSLPDGLMLQAGGAPEIGDVNRREGTPLLDEMARAIEPVTLFGNPALGTLFGHASGAAERWERRFLR